MKQQVDYHIMTVAIKFENVSKQYRLGEVGTGTLSHDLHRAWARMRGKPDPFAKVGQVNNRSEKSDGDGADSKYVWALKDIDFEVEQGEILGIIGRNGAGKSTLLKILSRVTAPSSGSIKAKGRIASLLEVGTGFHPELTGRENIYLNGAILGMRRHEITKKLEEIVDFSGCAKFIDTPVKRYSSGMTVRLGFAVAAHLDCEILVVDEVLAVGDVEFQRKCIEKMQEVASGNGKTILFVSHNLASVRKLCTASILLSNGELAKTGSTNDVILSYTNDSRKESIETELSKQKHRGNQKAKFTDVSILDLEGKRKEQVASGEDFTMLLKFRLNSKDNIGNVICSVALKDDTDSNVWLIRSSFDGHSLDINNQSFVHCRIRDFALAPGQYRGVLFMSERDNEVIDHVENAFSLTVLPGPFFPTGSPGLPSHCKTLTRATWNVH